MVILGKTSCDHWGWFASDHLHTSHQTSRQFRKLHQHLQNQPKAQCLSGGWPSSCVPLWGPALPSAFPSSTLGASVSNCCCWQDSDGPNTGVRAKLKWLKTSPAAVWCRLTLTSFRNVQLTQDAGVRAAKAISLLARVYHGVTGCPRQAKIAAGVHQNRLPASDYSPRVFLLCPFQFFNLHPLSAFPRNGFIPGVIIDNGCTIFAHFHPRQISINLPITEMCAQLETMCQLKAPSFNKHVLDTHSVLRCHCITSRHFLCKFSIAFTENSKSCSKNDLFLRACRIHCVFLQHMFSSNSNLVRAILLGLPEKLTSKLNYKKTPPHVPPEFLKKVEPESSHSNVFKHAFQLSQTWIPFGGLSILQGVFSLK